MAFVGMLALGIFIGSVVAIALQQATAYPHESVKVVGAIIAAAFGGAVATWLDRWWNAATDRSSFFMYPVGLVVGLMWFYIPAIMRQTGWIRVVALAGLVAITSLAAIIALVPPFRKWLG